MSPLSSPPRHRHSHGSRPWTGARAGVSTNGRLRTLCSTVAIGPESVSDIRVRNSCRKKALLHGL